MEKQIICVVGDIGAGKDAVAEYIVEKYDAGHYTFSHTLKKILHELHLPDDRKNYALLAEALRETFGGEILSSALYEEVKEMPNEIIVAYGARKKVEIDYFKELRQFHLIYVDTDLKTRYERLTKRKQKPDDEMKTFEQFQEDHKRPADREISQLKDIADFVIDNNGTLEELHQKVDQIVRNIRNEK